MALSRSVESDYDRTVTVWRQLNDALGSYCNPLSTTWQTARGNNGRKPGRVVSNAKLKKEVLKLNLLA